MSIPKELTQNSVALTNDQIKSFCDNQDLEYHVIDLENLASNDYYYTFIFTGNEPNKSNNGNTHHWLFCIDKYVFDSYGKKDYNLPEGYIFMEHKPSQLQHYDDNVCGEYCCLLYMTYDMFSKNKIDEQDPKDAGQLLIDKLSLSNDQINNDEIILSTFNTFKK